MKFNNKRVTVYRDRKGPYDGYYKHGSIYATLNKHQTVSYAFDYDGMHYGIIRHKTHIKIISLFTLFIALIAMFIYYVTTYKTNSERLIVYMPHAPTVINNDTLLIEITNLMPESAYITVGEETYEITAGDTLVSIPYFSSIKHITITYNGYSCTEDIEYD